MSSVSASHERMLVRLHVFVRVGMLSLAAVSLVLIYDRYRYPVAVAAVLTALAAESAVVFVRCRRRGELCGWRLAGLDAGCGLAGLAVVTWLMVPRASGRSDDIMYPYTVASMALVGGTATGLALVLAVPAGAAVCYVALVSARFAFTATLLENAATYWIWAVIPWLISARFRSLTRAVDTAQHTALAREAELAAERDRLRIARDLHDRVLQTLEAITRDGLVGPGWIRDHIAQEAEWLRELVESGFDRRPDALRSVLERVIERQTGLGLRVEVNTAGLDADARPLPAASAEAVAGAVEEALTNVRKHAGVARAVVRAVWERDALVVTVLDHGTGFDPAAATPGVGLARSVIQRIGDVGGTARISSTPGEGTHVRLTVPVRTVP